MPSLYDVSIPVFIRMLENIDHCLGKAAAKCMTVPYLYPIPCTAGIAGH